MQPDRGLAAALSVFTSNTRGKTAAFACAMDTNQINAPARALYKRLGYREAGIVPCDFNGLGQIRLVCLEKLLDEAEG